MCVVYCIEFQPHHLKTTLKKMKVAILLSTLLVATACAITTDNLSDIKVPTAKDIGTAFAKSEDALLRQAGEKMLDPADTCSSSTRAVGPCSVSVSVCSTLVRHFFFYFSATACASGVCADSTDSFISDPDGASQQAIYNLMLMHPSCACGGSNTTIGTCNFELNSCFQLDPTLSNPSFYASATCTKNAVSAEYCCAATGEDAAKAAMTALAGKMNIQTTCM
jgi:hypothetical protein